MKLHERYFTVQDSLLGGQVARSAKYLIRQERHGDADKKGDET